MWPERTAARISCASWVPTSVFFFPSIIRSICLCREIKKCAVWQTSDKVLEIDGFCVCDAAQSFLGLGKGTQVLYSTSNNCSTLCDPDNTFHTNAFSGRFSFLEATHVPAQEKHHLSFSNPCVCQISNTITIHLLPNVSKVGLDVSCLSVSFPAATATEKILGFDVSHCEL